MNHWISQNPIRTSNINKCDHGSNLSRSSLLCLTIIIQVILPKNQPQWLDILFIFSITCKSEKPKIHIQTSSLKFFTVNREKSWAPVHYYHGPITMEHRMKENRPTNTSVSSSEANVEGWYIKYTIPSSVHPRESTWESNSDARSNRRKRNRTSKMWVESWCDSELFFDVCERV